MMVAVMTLFPASRRIAETVIGITVSGSAIVTLAAHAPVETDNREIGRNHRYTSVPSSRVSPSDAEAKISATMGMSIDNPM